MPQVHFSEFSQRIRDKFRNASGQSPYDGIPDEVLATKFVEKFPEYRPQVDWGMNYASRVSSAAEAPQAVLPSGSVSSAPAIGVFPDPVSPESMGAPAIRQPVASRGPVRSPVASEYTAVRQISPVERPAESSSVWADEQARRAQMSQPTLTIGEQQAKAERDIVAADEAEYQKYVSDYYALWEADKKNRSGRAILDYRLSGGKRPLMRDEFALVRAGYAVSEAWIPPNLEAAATRSRTPMQALGEASEFVGRTLMRPVIRAIDAVSGVEPRFSDLSHASNVRRNFEVQSRVDDLRNAEKSSLLTEGEKQYLQENDPSFVSQTVEAVKSLPEMGQQLIENPETRRQFAVGMATDLPGSLALSGGASLALDAMKGVKSVMKLRNVRKGFEGRAAKGTFTAEQAAKATERWAQMEDGKKAIEDMWELMRKRPPIAEGILRETVGDGLADAVVETLNGTGRGEQTGVVANLISGLPVDALPYLMINTGKRVAQRVVDGPDRGLNRGDFDAAVGALELSPTLSDAVTPTDGKKAGSTAIRPQVDELMSRPDARERMQQVADLAKNPETSNAKYRLSNQDLQVELSQKELENAGYAGRDAGVQSVRGFTQDVPTGRLVYEPGATMKDYAEGRVPLERGTRQVATVGAGGDGSTVAHETIHGIENRLREEGYGKTPNPEAVKLIDAVDDWTERAYQWGKDNGVILPGPKELVTQVMTYRLGWNDDFDPIVKLIPVPDDLVKSFASRAGGPLSGSSGLRLDGTKMDDLPLPVRQAGDAPAAPKEYVPDADLGFSLAGKKVDSDRPRLRVTHNLDSDKLRKVDEVGGFARPSLAVMRADQSASDDFGDITLVGKPHLGDPSIEPVYDRDVYSPRVPDAKWKINKQVRALADNVRDSRRSAGLSGEGYLITYIERGDRERAFRYASIDPEGIALFLKEKGELPAPIMKSLEMPEPFKSSPDLFEKVEELWDKGEYTEANKTVYKAETKRLKQIANDTEEKGAKNALMRLARTFAELAKTGDDSYILSVSSLLRSAGRSLSGRASVDDMANSARLREIGKEREAEINSWWRARLNEVMPSSSAVVEGSTKPYNLDNLVSSMKGTKAKEGGMTYSTGMAKANAAKKFRNVEAMREHATRFMEPKPENVPDNGLLDAVSSLARYSKYEWNSLSKMDYASEAIGKLAAGKVTEARAKSILSADHEVSHAAIKVIMEAAESIKEIKTDMFEGKPQRAVYFNEFGGAVVPEDVPQETIDLLRSRGITRIEKYARHDKEARTQALNKFDDLQFSLASDAGVPDSRADDPKVVEAARKAWKEKGVESPWFKRWFGDSKVVDESGKPLVVYHGTGTDFNAFSADKIGSNFSDSMGASNNPHDGGFFFTSRKSSAKFFADGAGDSPRVVEAYLNLQNPYIEDVGDYWDAAFKVDNANFKRLREKGYDGMIVRSQDGSLFVAFSPTQIKSATGNRGTFDEGSPDIRYSLSKDDPRQKILTHVTKSMRENGLKPMSQNDMSSEWRTYSKKAKSDPAQRAKEEKAWDAVEGSLRQYVSDNPTIAAEAGLTPPAEGKLDEFDLTGAVDQFRVWTNSKTQGKFSREELDHFAQAVDAAKGGPGSSGIEMNKRPMSWLAKSKESRAGSSVLFDSMGERFVAKWNGKEGVWNVKHPKSGESFTVPRDGSVWVDGATKSGPQFDEVAYPLRDDRKLSAANAEQTAMGEGDLSKTETEEGKIDALARHVQDSMRDLRVLQNRVKEKGADPYREYDLAAGRGDRSSVKMRERFLNPVLKIMEKHGLDQETVDSYLYARHAAERNQYVAAKNADMPDGGSGMSTKEAESILSNFSQDAVRNRALESIGDINDKLNDWRSEMLVQSGLRSEADAKAMKSTWAHYVPLRGIPGDEEVRSDVFRGKVAAQDKKKALGRKSKAESVLAQNFAVTLDAIVNAQRNIAANELWKMAQSNPDAKYWELDPSYVRQVQGKDGKVMQMADIERMQKAPGIVPVYIKGEPHYIEFKTPEGARIAAAIKELNAEQSNTLIRGLGKVNRFVGSMITRYSPEFVLTNFSRDYLTALTVAYARDGGKIARKMVTDAPAAVVGLARNEMGVKNEWGDWKARWEDAGGKVGFTQSKDFKTLAGEIDDDLKSLQRSNYNPKKWGSVVGKVVEAANGSVESATRLAYFRALVENGVDEKVAAQKSKELTVNFNRRGDWKWANQFWMFFNASVQGSANIASLFTDKDPAVRKRAFAAAGAIASAGAAVALFNQFLGGEDQDSGKTHYERLPGWAKGNSAVIMNPFKKDGTALTIPLPYGLNVIWNVGRMMAEGATRKDGFTTMDAASEIASSIVGSFSPFGADIDPSNVPGTVLGLGTPTAVKPWSELALNKNFSGRPIMPENIPGMTNKPESELYYQGVNPYARELAAFLNEMTDGDKWHSGAVSVSPEKMEHVFNAYTGGVGRMLQQGFGIAKTWGEGEATTIRQWPFARRFFSTPPEGVDRSAFMDQVLTPAKQDMQQLKDMAKEDDPGVDSFVDEHYSNIVASAAFGGLKTKEKRLKRAENLGEKIGSEGVKDEYRAFFAKAWKAKRAMDSLQEEHNATDDKAKRAELRRQIEKEAEKAFEGFGE